MTTNCWLCGRLFHLSIGIGDYLRFKPLETTCICEMCAEKLGRYVPSQAVCTGCGRPIEAQKLL